MIDLSWSHILLVVVVALVVVGPKDLPKLMRTVGRWMGKARAMADQFRKSFDEMTRQAELHELRAEIEALRSTRPLADVQAELSKPILPAEMTSKPAPPPAPPPDSGKPEAAAEAPKPASP